MILSIIIAFFIVIAIICIFLIFALAKTAKEADDRLREITRISSAKK